MSFLSIKTIQLFKAVLCPLWWPIWRLTDLSGRGRAENRLFLFLLPSPRVPFLGLEDLLGEEMATHPSVLAWELPWTENPGGLQSIASQESDRVSD